MTTQEVFPSGQEQETKLPVRKVAAADVPSSPRHGGDLRVVLGPETTGVTSGFMGTSALAPGERISERYHPYSEMFTFVVEGELEYTTDGKDVHRVAAGEGIVIPRMTRYSVANTSSAPALGVFHACPLAPSPELGHVDTEEPDAE